MVLLNSLRRSSLRLLSPARPMSTSSLPNLYGYPTSQPYRSVAMFCKTAGVEYTYQHVNIFKEFKTPEFLNINPAGHVPAWQENGFSLGESAAILQYIAESRNLEKYYPKDPKTRAKIAFWLHWHHTNSRIGTMGVLVPRIRKGQESKIAKGDKDYTAVVIFLDKSLENSKFLVGDSLTIADFLIIPEIDQLGKPGYDIFDYTPYKNVQRYLESFKREVSYYDESFSSIIKAAEKLDSVLHPK